MANNKIKVSIVVPCVVVHNLDPHTGIPFMPHMAAYLGGALDRFGYDVQIIDCFGLNPHHRRIDGEFMFLGVDEQWVVDHVGKETKVVFVYCRTIEDLVSTERICTKMLQDRPDINVCVFENIQTVNSFSLKEVVKQYIDMGVRVGIMGEPEWRCDLIVKALLTDIDALRDIKGVAYKDSLGNYHLNEDETFNKALDDCAFPLWERLPIEGYWKANFAHAPCSGRKFLPLLTSRGCPYRCTFCVSPAINPSWRARSAKSIADEIEYFYNLMGITDFHVSDLDPTVSDKRTREIALELIARRLPITWKIAQGTKIETIKSERTLELLAQSGCSFLSFSPESGSKRMLKLMNKSFDHEHALRLTRKMHALGMRTQACFIAGVPGEEETDRRISIEYVKLLVKAGIDEIAVTIFTPIPGAALSKAMSGYVHYSQLTHSPTWRSDYKVVQYFRFRMYLVFFVYKILFPRKLAREIWGVLSRRFQTKMEMSIYKQVKLYALYHLPFLFTSLNADRLLAEASTTFSLATRKFLSKSSSR